MRRVSFFLYATFFLSFFLMIAQISCHCNNMCYTVALDSTQLAKRLSDMCIERNVRFDSCPEDVRLHRYQCNGEKYSTLLHGDDILSYFNVRRIDEKNSEVRLFWAIYLRDPRNFIEKFLSTD